MTNWTAETAEWYAEKYGEYPTNRLAVDALDLAADATVVDVGCGTGAALRQAAVYVTEGRLIGIDPVPRMVEIAREKTAVHQAAKQITFFEGGAENLPVEADVADVVLAFDSFDHWDDKQKGLSEIQRILQADGLFAIVKDGNLPGGQAAKQAFMTELAKAGFEVLQEQARQDEGISFTLWLCGLKS